MLVNPQALRATDNEANGVRLETTWLIGRVALAQRAIVFRSSTALSPGISSANWIFMTLVTKMIPSAVEGGEVAA